MTDNLKKIKEVKELLLSYVKDEYQKEATEAISDLLSAQAQSDVEEVELCIPAKAVVRTVDLGPIKLCETTKGVYFSAKNSLHTLVDPQQGGINQMLINVMDNIEKKFENFKDADDREFNESFAQMWLYILQAPLFCFIDPVIAADTSVAMLTAFNQKAKELIEQPLAPENPAKDGEFLNAVQTVEEPAAKIKRKKK